MAADLAIHVFAPGELFEDDLRNFFSNTWGSKWFNPKPTSPSRSVAFSKMLALPHVFVGEVSWLKALVFDDQESFIPSPVAKISEIIGEDLPMIDDQLIGEIQEAFNLPNHTNFDLQEMNEVVSFLNEHKGKQAFCISW